MPGAALGDAVGISRMLGRRRCAGGEPRRIHDRPAVRVRDGAGAQVRHRGADQRGSAGSDLNHGLVRDAMAHYAGVVETDPEPSARDAAASVDFIGVYDTIAMAIDVRRGTAAACSSR